MSVTDHLVFLLQSRFGPKVLIASAFVKDLSDQLLPAEMELVSKVTLKRLREFSTGRVLARQLLAEMGAAAGALLARPGGSADWPDGFSGSISHTAEICVVATAYASDVSCLGIDIENRGAVKPEMVPVILRRSEISWLEGRPPHPRNEWATVIFSAKECFFKARYFHSRTTIDFTDVKIVFSEEPGAFKARVASPDSATHGVPLDGFFVFYKHWVVSGICE